MQRENTSRLVAGGVTKSDIDVLRRLASGSFCLFRRVGDGYQPAPDDLQSIDLGGPWRGLVHADNLATLDRLCFLAARRGETIVERVPIPLDPEYRMLEVSATVVDSADSDDAATVLCSGKVVRRHSLLGPIDGPPPELVRDAWESGRFGVRYDPLHEPGSGRLRGVSTHAVVALNEGDEPRRADELLVELKRAGVLPELEQKLLTQSSAAVALWNKVGRTRLVLHCHLQGPQTRTGEMIRTVRMALARSGLPPELLTLELPGIHAAHPAAASVSMHLAGFGIGTGVGDLLCGHLDLSAFTHMRNATFAIPARATGGQFDRFAPSLSFIANLVRRLGGRLRVGGVATDEHAALLKGLGAELVSGSLFGEGLQVDQFDSRVSEAIA